jgi:chromosome segregation ATPase
VCHSNSLVEKKKEFADLEERGAHIAQKFNKIKKDLAEKKKEAESEAPLADENGRELPLKSQLEALDVQHLNDVEAALEEANLKADSIVANPAVIRQYTELKEKIEAKQTELESLSSSKNSKLSVIETKKKMWETSLQSNVAKINALFTKYMAIMGCTGEVGLIKGKSGETPNENGNFKQWGIEIRVSFREGTKAQVLSAQVQSGGERSVSTIMYLMALQDMMVSPFRCVDEINQGLDDRNERLVFQRIVKNSTRVPKSCPTDHSGQYFLITPKLLPNLYDMEQEAMTILFVFNGKFNVLSRLVATACRDVYLHHFNSILQVLSTSSTKMSGTSTQSLDRAKNGRLRTYPTTRKTRTAGIQYPASLRPRRVVSRTKLVSTVACSFYWIQFVWI